MKYFLYPGYAYNNQYNATLVLVELASGSEKTSVELKINYRAKIELYKDLEPRVESLTVGASFDPKELIFRNYLNLLTSDSKIAVKVKFSEGKKGQVIKFGWFDPRLKLVESNMFPLNETSGVESVTPKLASPLMPGVWTVVGTLADKLLYKETFLILPTGETNQSYKHSAIKEDPSLQKFVDPSDKVEGDPESLIGRFFAVEDRCHVEDDHIVDYSWCHETAWSSFFPDSKSEILGIDPETGQIVEK